MIVAKFLLFSGPVVLFMKDWAVLCSCICKAVSRGDKEREAPN